MPAHTRNPVAVASSRQTPSLREGTDDTTWPTEPRDEGCRMIKLDALSIAPPSNSTFAWSSCSPPKAGPREGGRVTGEQTAAPHTD